jgi:uncharacterized sulfatase
VNGVLTEFTEDFLRGLNLKNFHPVELSCCHQRNGLRPGSIADANESLRTATKQFGELEVQGELTQRAWAICALGVVAARVARLRAASVPSNSQGNTQPQALTFIAPGGGCAGAAAQSWKRLAPARRFGATCRPPMNRSNLALATAALFFAAVAQAGAAAKVPAARPPNVILILADDLGWGDLGCYGHPQFKTPHLDRMAREGARLTSFYAPAPYCAPSRAALLTGRYQFRSGMVNNPSPDTGVNDIGLPASELTLAELLRAAGYRTMGIGKWHLGHKPEFFPTRHGFDEYLGILYSNDMRPVQLLDGEKVVEYPVVQATLTRRYTERALAFIERHRHRPFFLYLPHAMPHKPLAAAEAFYRKSGAGLYGDALAELDWSVGQILAKLKELGLEERTLVLFTSDNGPWYGGSTGGLRGMKGTTWDGGLRVPLIARWPGKIPAGHVSAAPAILPDLFATVLKAAGVALPKDRPIDGQDLWPLLTTNAPGPHDALFSMAGPRLMTVRSGKWKLHVHPPGGRPPAAPDEKWTDPRAPDGVTLLAPFEQYHPSQYPGVATGDAPTAMMLFDLEADPAEQRNIAAQHPEVVERLRKLYEEMAKQMPTPPARPQRQRNRAN